jgi:hypothetical protein
VCAILLTLMARALLLISPIAKEPISFLSLSCVNCTTLSSSPKHHLKCLQKYCNNICRDFSTLHSPLPSSLPAIVNTLKQVCCVVLPGQINHFGKVLENNQSSGWSHNDNECQGGVGWSRPITTQLLSIHPSIHLFSAYQVETNDKCLMLYQTRILHKREKRKFV